MPKVTLEGNLYGVDYNKYDGTIKIQLNEKSSVKVNPSQQLTLEFYADQIWNAKAELQNGDPVDLEKRGTVTYDGLMMDFGLLANGRLAPAAGPAVVAYCWSSAYLAAGGEEEGRFRATYEKDYEEKMLKVDTWFENGIPIYAEVCYNGQRILNLTISEFSLK